MMGMGTPSSQSRIPRPIWVSLIRSQTISEAKGNLAQRVKFQVPAAGYKVTELFAAAAIDARQSV